MPQGPQGHDSSGQDSAGEEDLEPGARVLPEPGDCWAPAKAAWWDGGVWNGAAAREPKGWRVAVATGSGG